MGLREVTDRFINVSFVPGAERKAREKAAMTTIAMTMNGEMGKMWKSMNICYGDNGVVLGNNDRRRDGKVIKTLRGDGIKVKVATVV